MGFLKFLDFGLSLKLPLTVFKKKSNSYGLLGELKVYSHSDRSFRNWLFFTYIYIVQQFAHSWDGEEADQVFLLHLSKTCIFLWFFCFEDITTNKCWIKVKGSQLLSLSKHLSLQGTLFLWKRVCSVCVGGLPPPSVQCVSKAKKRPDKGCGHAPTVHQLDRQARSVQPFAFRTRRNLFQGCGRHLLLRSRLPASARLGWKRKWKQRPAQGQQRRSRSPDGQRLAQNLFQIVGLCAHRIFWPVAPRLQASH